MSVIRNWSTIVIVMVICIAAAFGLSESARQDAVLLRDASIKACERDNAFREANNERGNLLRALLNQQLDNQEQAIPQIKIRDIPLTNCQAVYPKP